MKFPEIEMAVTLEPDRVFAGDDDCVSLQELTAERRSRAESAGFLATYIESVIARLPPNAEWEHNHLEECASELRRQAKKDSK